MFTWSQTLAAGLLPGYLHDLREKKELGLQLLGPAPNGLPGLGSTRQRDGRPV